MIGKLVEGKWYKKMLACGCVIREKLDYQFETVCNQHLQDKADRE
jgi:hypothetical protein